MLTFSVYQHNRFFSNTLLGSCEMPLSLCFEQLVSAAKSCNPSEAGSCNMSLQRCMSCSICNKKKAVQVGVESVAVVQSVKSMDFHTIIYQSPRPS